MKEKPCIKKHKPRETRVMQISINLEWVQKTNAKSSETNREKRESVRYQIIWFAPPLHPMNIQNRIEREFQTKPKKKRP